MTYQRRLNPLVIAVLTAITSQDYSSDEREWIKRIERRRSELARSSETMEYTDYGAGNPRNARTVAQMYDGVPRQQTVGHLTKAASKSPKWAGLLLRLLRETQPSGCIELGAAAGISTAYQAAALTLNGTGHLVTLEGGKSIADLASDTLANLKLGDVAEVLVGRFQDTLEPALVRDTIDYAFIDGQHDRDATCTYFDLIAERMGDRGVIVLDDINWSQGMREAWQHVSRQDCVAASFDLGAIGVCVISTEDQKPLHCTIELD